MLCVFLPQQNRHNSYDFLQFPSLKAKINVVCVLVLCLLEIIVPMCVYKCMFRFRHY